MAARDTAPWAWGDAAPWGIFQTLFGSTSDAIAAGGAVDRVLYPGQGYTGPITVLGAGLGNWIALDDMELYSFQVVQAAGTAGATLSPVAYTMQVEEADVAATLVTLADLDTVASALVDIDPGQVPINRGEQVRWHRTYTGNDAADVAPECVVICQFGPRRTQIGA